MITSEILNIHAVPDALLDAVQQYRAGAFSTEQLLTAISAVARMLDISIKTGKTEIPDTPYIIIKDTAHYYPSIH
ncbi:MAG: hypothetical protein IKI30_00195 [Oxalobacter sp.]|nr:hypothetical protein [Oxalobacter sp.]